MASRNVEVHGCMVISYCEEAFAFLPRQSPASPLEQVLECLKTWRSVVCFSDLFIVKVTELKGPVSRTWMKPSPGPQQQFSMEMSIESAFVFRTRRHLAPRNRPIVYQLWAKAQLSVFFYPLRRICVISDWGCCRLFFTVILWFSSSISGYNQWSSVSTHGQWVDIVSLVGLAHLLSSFSQCHMWYYQHNT